MVGLTLLTSSPLQVACALAYGGSLALWAYAEVLAYSRRWAARPVACPVSAVLHRLQCTEPCIMATPLVCLWGFHRLAAPLPGWHICC